MLYLENISCRLILLESVNHTLVVPDNSLAAQDLAVLKNRKYNCNGYIQKESYRNTP